MDTEKSGAEAGGFLQIFDWKSKSRNKFSSSKPDTSGKSKRKFGTSLHVVDEDEIGSCDEVPNAGKAPGVVAKLMGLDSLPKSNPFQSKQSNMIHRFQAEILPPKSTKSIPTITTKNAAAQTMGASSVPLKVKQMAQATQRSHEGEGKSISLALQAKVNVLKRERQSMIRISQNESEVINNQSVVKKSKALMPNGSTVLRQNNQKQNCVVDRGSLPQKDDVQGLVNEQSARSKASSRKLKPQFKEDKKKELCSSIVKTGSKKRNTNLSYRFEGNGNESGQRKRKNKEQKETVQFSISENMIETSGDKENGMRETEAISFTFNTLVSGSGHGSWRAIEANETCNIFPYNTKTRKKLQESVDLGPSESGDTFSSSLEQKSELFNHSQQNIRKISQLVEPGLKSLTKSTRLVDKRMKENFTDNFQRQPVSTSGLHTLREPLVANPKLQVETTGIQEQKRFADTDRCNNVDTVYNNTTAASSTCTTTVVRKPDATLYLQGSRNPPNSWELDYVKEVLSDIEIMFKDYAFGRTTQVINPPLFYQIECRRLCSNSNTKGLIPRIIRRLWFDCISECTDYRCRHYVGEGWESWAKGLRMVQRKDELAEDICKEISDFTGMGQLMLDEIVDRDMSSKHGTWQHNYELEGFEVGTQIETWILNYLVDEIAADILSVRT